VRGKGISGLKASEILFPLCVGRCATGMANHRQRFQVWNQIRYCLAPGTANCRLCRCLRLEPCRNSTVHCCYFTYPPSNTENNGYTEGLVQETHCCIILSITLTREITPRSRVLLEERSVATYSRIFQHFMEPEGLFPCSRVPPHWSLS
jgi:hypothetical protein